tara:strand:- start:510 stop:1379 length:870 start_codon:yes stop_codon:yes gene_type:complete
MMQDSIEKKYKPKVKLQITENYKFVNEVVTGNKLHTVCAEARCPNIFECWDRGTATIMILGDTCTRACGFCSVKTGKPTWSDSLEPYRTAIAVKKMNLKHVVITSVDRDDLKNDYGAHIWSETILQIHEHVPNCSVEVLTPDFKGYKPAINKVFNARPEIFSHNVECVERISKKVRSQSVWTRSLKLLKLSSEFGLRTKTGIMVGLGESYEEVLTTMKEVRAAGVEIFTVGQYLQPTKNHLPVNRYVAETEFLEYEKFGLDLGFSIVKSGSLVRSSYRAEEGVEKLFKV